MVSTLEFDRHQDRIEKATTAYSYQTRENTVERDQGPHLTQPQFDDEDERDPSIDELTAAEITELIRGCCKRYEEDDISEEELYQMFYKDFFGQDRKIFSKATTDINR